MTPAKFHDREIRDLKRAQLLPAPLDRFDEGGGFTPADHRKPRNALKRQRRAHRGQR